MDFFPPKKQTEEYLKSVFIEKGLAEVVKLHKAQASQEAKRELTQVRITIITFERVIVNSTLGKNSIESWLFEEFFKKISLWYFECKIK